MSTFASEVGYNCEYALEQTNRKRMIHGTE